MYQFSLLVYLLMILSDPLLGVKSIDLSLSAIIAFPWVQSYKRELLYLYSIVLWMVKESIFRSQGMYMLSLHLQLFEPLIKILVPFYPATLKGRSLGRGVDCSRVLLL
jgi:hypothetical protein